ncbi:MAG: lectin [Candidatus Paceibacterota bacterium]|jgi:hypothetical protein
MNKNITVVVSVIFLLVVIVGSWYIITNNSTLKSQKKMTFFVTSVNPGSGADLGGIAGADKYCQTLAENAGSAGLTWHAYLSTNTTDGTPAINARDRIGNGPWVNFAGIVIANNLTELHENNNLNKQTALTEKGEIINGRGDTPNMHDMLTGSDPEGSAIISDTDATCKNWTSSNEGSAMLGHHDRVGLQNDIPSKSWNSSHLSRGCSLENLKSTGGAGLFYCFAL